MLIFLLYYLFQLCLSDSINDWITKRKLKSYLHAKFWNSCKLLNNSNKFAIQSFILLCSFNLHSFHPNRPTTWDSVNLIRKLTSIKLNLQKPIGSWKPQYWYNSTIWSGKWLNFASTNVLNTMKIVGKYSIVEAKYTHLDVKSGQPVTHLI